MIVGNREDGSMVDCGVYWVYYISVTGVQMCFFTFFFNDTATTEIYTLSLHDALPIPILKGKLEIQSFTLPFVTCDIECADVELEEQQKAVFFLQSVENGIATLSVPGGVAIFPEGYFY